MASTNDVILIGIIIFTFAIAFFAVFFMSKQVTDQMLSISVINDSAATREVIQSSDNIRDRLDYVIFAVFIGLILALLISGWFVGGNPLFMAIYFIIIVIGIAASAVLANVWETTSTSSVFGTTVASFPITNNILLNLPIYTAVIGFLGMIVMFAKPYLMGNNGGGTY